MARPFAERLILAYVESRLKRVEKSFLCELSEAGQDSHCSPVRAELARLAIRAVVACRSTIHLMREDLRHEAEASFRVFLESYVHLMYFSWCPDVHAFLEWCSKPTQPLTEKEWHIREWTEKEIARRNMVFFSNNMVSLNSYFAELSNTAVHPTRESADRAWSDAIRRLRKDSEADWGKSALLSAWTIRVMVHLHRFVFFLADEQVFPIPKTRKDCKNFEHILRRGLDAFKAHLQRWVDQQDAQLAAGKRAARAAKRGGC